jgi:hypothetical protein
MLATAAGKRFVDGNLATASWDIGSISIRPVKKHTWTSKVTGLTYSTTYLVVLRAAGSPQRHSAVLTMTAVYGNQEVSFKGGRAVYEGLFRVSGLLDGKRVSGQAWGEVQPAHQL